MREAIGYRGLQAVSIALLAALVTACVVFVPLYERAMLQALTRTELRSAGVAARSLQVTATAGSTDYGTDIEAGSPEQLASLVPASVREAYDAPIAQEQARVDFEPASRRIQGSTGPLVWREDFCAHIELAAGRCPRQRAEIAIGMDDAKVFEVPVGSTVRVPGEADAGSGRGAPLLALRVVGTYRERPSDYWFDTTLTGFAGKQDGPQSPVKHDVWLTPQSTFTAATTPKLSGLRNQVDYPLDVSRTGVDQLDRLGPALNRLSRRLASQPTYGTTMSTSSLPAIDEEVDHQGRQARITIPLLTAQVALLAVVALALVLSAATEQRRPEVAVAMLRGRGRRGARALLLHELLPVVLAGVVIGAGMALVLGAVARATVLPGPVPFELGLGPAVAVLAAVLTVVLVTVLAVRRVSSEPVEQLLRRVPVRRSGWSLGALEAIVVAGAATVVVVFLTGGLSGPVVLAAPVMLAVVVGLLLSHATTPVTAHLGRRILQRGRVGLGVSVLDAARTPATRRSLAIVTVASAVLVFSLSAVAVGGRNREAAAEQQAGAAMRVEVEGQDLPGIRAAVASVDPSGRSLTPVVTVQPPGVGAAATVAVQPTAFSTIALFGNTRPLDPKTLAPPRAAPIQLHGDALRVRIDAENVMVVQPGASKPSVSLLLDLSDPSGNVTQVPIGALPLGVRSGPEAIRATVPCRQGCYLTAITVRTRVGSKVSGIVALSDLTAVSEGDETPVALGPSAAWDTVPGVLTDQMVPDAPGKQRLAIRLATAGGADTVMHQAWLPSRLPVVVAAAAKPGAGRAITVSGIDGIERSGVRHEPVVPGAGRRAGHQADQPRRGEPRDRYRARLPGRGLGRPREPHPGPSAHGGAAEARHDHRRRQHAQRDPERVPRVRRRLEPRPRCGGGPRGAVGGPARGGDPGREHLALARPGPGGAADERPAGLLPAHGRNPGPAPGPGRRRARGHRLRDRGRALRPA